MTKSKKQPTKATVATAHVPAAAVARAAARYPVSLTVKMQRGGSMRLAIVLDDGTLVGKVLATLLLDERGIDYRRLNQKKGTGRVLTWQTLDRLMQVGLC